MFSIATVASSTSIPTASASPPSVITFSESPESLSPITAVRIESGIDRMTISMLRADPRKISTISATSPAAIAASRTTPISAPRTNTDWSNASRIFIPLGAVSMIDGSVSLTWSTTVSVEAAACL
jgi:hypothetical protein